MSVTMLRIRDNVQSNAWCWNT